MNTTQTPAAVSPQLAPLTQALLTDFDDPDLSELDLCRRHALTLDELRAHTRTPAFRHALAVIRELRGLRRPLILARAEADAARTLSALAARVPTSATAAKEARLATKDLLRILGAGTPPLGAGGFQPPDRAKPDPVGGASHLGAADFQPPDRAKPDPVGEADFQPPDRPQPDPLNTTPRPTHKPKHPCHTKRNTKPSSKARSR